MKRTRQIDENREIQVDTRADGLPIFATVGQLEPNQEEKEKIHVDLVSKQHEQRTNNIKNLILENAALLGHKVFCDVAPENVIEASYQAEVDPKARKLMDDWLVENRFQVIQDGLRTTIKMKGKVLVDMDAKTDGFIPGDIEIVEQLLRKQPNN